MRHTLLYIIGIVTFMLITTVFPTSAQTAGTDASTDMNRRISQVKRDTTYLYAEATMSTAAEATDGARAILEMTVTDWVRSQHPTEGIEMCITKAKEHCQLVQTRRGNYYRSFFFVKKTDILPIIDSSEVMVIHMDSTTMQPVTTSPTPPTTASPTATVPAAISSLEQQMTVITSFYNVEPFVQQLRQQNRLEAYGKYATMPVDSACHLFVYDQEGQVRAVLRRNRSGEMLNLRTMQSDAISNYRQCGAIWIRIRN